MAMKDDKLNEQLKNTRKPPLTKNDMDSIKKTMEQVHKEEKNKGASKKNKFNEAFK